MNVVGHVANTVRMVIMSSILSIPRHRLVVALVVLGVGLLGVGDTLASRGSSQALKNIMRLKLGHSQKILEAIVLEDFDAIEEHGRQLARLIESSEWRILQTPEFARRASSWLAREASEARIAATSSAAAMPLPTTSAMAIPQRSSPREMNS